MATKTIEESDLITIHKGTDSKTKKALESKFGKETFTPKKGLITTWEEACKIKRIHKVNSLPFPKPNNQRQKSINAGFMIDVMSEILNTDSNGKRWVPNWNDGNQAKWYPWFDYKNGRFSFDGSSNYYASAFVGARLSYKDKATSDHAGKYLQALYNEYFTL